MRWWRFTWCWGPSLRFARVRMTLHSLQHSPAADKLLYSHSPRKDLSEPLHLRSYPAQLLFNALIAAVDVVDAIDDGLVFGHQRGQHQRGRGAQVAGLHRRAA